jgi:hypothetical protein
MVQKIIAVARLGLTAKEIARKNCARKTVPIIEQLRFQNGVRRITSGTIKIYRISIVY